MSARNDSKDEQDPKGAAKAGAGDQKPDGVDAGTEAAQDVVLERLDEQQSKGFWGTEVDLTPNENYTVAGVSSGADVPEAHANKVSAQAAATNPLVQHPLSEH